MKPLFTFGGFSSLAVALLLVLSPSVNMKAQELIGAHTRWSDSFREWEFVTGIEGETGKLYMRWPSRDDWTQWDFRLGDITADMRLVWRDNPNEWQIRCEGTVVSARTVFANDFRSWRLEDGDHRIVIQTRYGNVFDEWVLRDDNAGFYAIYTYREGDPREWIIENGLDNDVSLAMRLSLAFIAIYHSSPKI